MTSYRLTNLVCLVFILMSCGVAAASFSNAERYATYVGAGKDEKQHELHDKAARLWQQIQPDLAGLPSYERAKWWLARADLLQFEHRFDDALKAIDKVLTEGHLQQNALLMQARIHLTRHNLEAANSACNQLAEYSAMDIVATCLLEVRGRAGELDGSYQALQRLQSRNQDSRSALSLWRMQILAEQAQLLGRYDEALQWLEHERYAEQPLVVQKQIVDVFFAMGRSDAVLDLNEPCPQVNELPVDSMLVRIAHAERIQDNRSCWRDLAKERMQIRALRADELHTSDLAYYFIYVEPAAEHALHWAELNFSVAKEPFDRELLAAAEELQP